MALQDYNSLLIVHLEELGVAAELGDVDALAEFLQKLKEEGFDADSLAQPTLATEEERFSDIIEWVAARIGEMRGDANPFADDDFDFDIDDAFLDLEDTGFREPSEQENVDADLLGALDNDSVIEVVDDVPLMHSEEEIEDGLPHVLSGKFNMADPATVAADKEKRLSFSESLDAVAAQPDDEAVPPDRQTRPNLTPDLGEMRAQIATQRLDAAAGEADESLASVQEVSETEEPRGGAFRSPPKDPETREAPFADEAIEVAASAGFDFSLDDDDFGMPGGQSSAAGEVASDGEEFDFDLGLENPEERSAQDPSKTKPGPDDDDLETTERDRERTPVGLPAVDPEDMFFELAEALAAESSVAYPGKPLQASDASTTAFGRQDMPTGTAIQPLAGGGDSAQSAVFTNMNAILLEAHRLRAAGELGAALDIAKKVLSRGEHADATALRVQIEGELETAYLAELGPLDQTPTLLVELDNISELALDHRAGYVISQVDGVMTYEDLLELSGMPRLESLGVFCALLGHGVISAGEG